MAIIPSMSDLAFLTTFTTLEQLDISSSGVRSLAPLSSCVALQQLSIKHCPVADLSPLSACIALKRIILKGQGDWEQVKNSGGARLAGLTCSEAVNYLRCTTLYKLLSQSLKRGC